MSAPNSIMPSGLRYAHDDLPIHFFTIVLNGEPFIRHHMEVLKDLPFRWHWHIVEGVASLVHDTAWSVALGGRVESSLHDHGRSNDGTSKYLDEIARSYPGQITLYRKPLDQFWNGKKEMVSAPLVNIREECLLWQIDSDELWTPLQISAVRGRFIDEPQRSAAYFWCHYFVGPESIISTRYNYAQNPEQEWLRVWRYQHGDTWAAHEPPTLVRSIDKVKRRLLRNTKWQRQARRGKLVDIAKVAPFLHDETEAFGAVFQHFAYVTEEQLRFKEIYYGYKNAVAGWRDLQIGVAAGKPVLLRDYLPWVTDGAMADAASRLGIKPIAVQDVSGAWRFEPSDEPSEVVLSGQRSLVSGAPNKGLAAIWRRLSGNEKR